MNKFSILGLSVVLAAGFASCDNYEEPNPMPQTNAQGTVLDAANVALASNLSGSYNLKEAGEIVVATITAPNLGETFGYKAVAEIAAGDDFGKLIEVPATVARVPESDNYSVVVAAAELQNAYYSTITRDPREKTIKIRYAIYALGADGDMEARVGGKDYFYGPFDLTVVPYPAEVVIEDAYYLVGTASDWEVATAVKLSHAGGVSVYDDPVFSAKFDLSEGWGWKIIPQSTFEKGDWNLAVAESEFGVESADDDSLAGILVGNAAGAEAIAGTVSVAGPYLLTVNMEQRTFEFSFALEQLYTPGNSNGWSQTASQILTTTDYVTYTGVAHLNGEFKFTSAPDWNGINYGFAEEGKLSTDGGAGNINAGADGLYWCSVNVPSLTYALTPITTLGLIGDFNGWGSDVDLTPSADFLVWTGSVTLDGGSFKVRANDAWDIDFGGTLDNVVAKGSNIPSPGAGTYTVTLDFSKVPYTMTLK